MKRYKAVLFATDGDWVTDYPGDSKEEVIEQLADAGSRWFFYPYAAIILHKGGLTTSRQRLIAALSEELQESVGLSIKTAGKELRKLLQCVGK